MPDYKEIYLFLLSRVNLAIGALPENDLAALILKEAEQICAEMCSSDE